MKPKNELIPKEWIKKAEEDELSILAILKEGGAPSVACFLSQQMAEKYLKAFLVARKKEFPKIHQLDRLLELCMRIEPDFEELEKDCIF